MTFHPLRSLFWTSYLKMVSLIIFAFLSNIGHSQSLNWDANKKLTWTDFKAPTKNWDVAAVTYCGISMSSVKTHIWNGKSTYKAFAEFQCDSSFYFPEKVDDDVLAHEQLHFDIAELYARKLNLILFEESFITAAKASELYDQIYKEYYDYQVQYEEDTELGTNYINQEKWAIRIQKQLIEIGGLKN
ncbi:hypothetical protein Oweho_2483 [Owenweeksia hongkongensis DSM 17368]|uniref:DUF922 domain-containing protein n=1 Tax=Owenweeksia hongkongensis (strain DSM 17368 / CIP 108786 / JCM 12287 / NRRL B-23963 / UST20020801) TaxID=926562 RepID=G8R7S2_OWEHD|nr:hypothetical protein [Owenweeksia hongkongensis]AEV33453.1 hypothetical protein Oweho_2483 [Owenweeksia hongkongensis DSM 17368]